MILRTENSLYEVELGRRRFRRLEGRVGAGAPPLGQWQPFGQIGAVRVGEPIRLYWLKQRAGAMVRIGAWTTAPVVEIVDAGAGEEHVSHTHRPQGDTP